VCDSNYSCSFINAKYLISKKIENFFLQQPIESLDWNSNKNLSKKIPTFAPLTKNEKPVDNKRSKFEHLNIEERSQNEKPYSISSKIKK